MTGGSSTPAHLDKKQLHLGNTFAYCKLEAEGFRRWLFPSSSAHRCYLEACVNPGGGMPPIQVATAHLESPDPPATMRCVERAVQAEHAVAALNRGDNVVFGGDMSWDDTVDLPFPLIDGWVDAWTQLKPGVLIDSSWTYNYLWNEEIDVVNGYTAYPWQMLKRSDRFVCKLKDYTLKGIEVIGTKGCASSRVPFGDIDLPPSCHRGLVLTIVPKGPAREENPLPSPTCAWQHLAGTRAWS
ncbi:hypothetical protein ACP4OV_029558 [Aristida adscensionis]